MKIKEAFTILNNAAAGYRGTRQEHLAINEALDKLAAFIMKHQPEELAEKTESNSS